MKRIKQFDTFVNEDWKLSFVKGELYTVKSPFSLRSQGASAPFASNNNQVEFEAGDTAMVGVQRGSLGDCYSVQKVNVNGDNVSSASKTVTVWRMEYTRPDFYRNLEPRKA